MNGKEILRRYAKRKAYKFLSWCMADEMKSLQNLVNEVQATKDKLDNANLTLHGVEKTLKIHGRLIDLLSENEIVAIDHHVRDKSWIVMVDKRHGGRNSVRFYSMDGDTPFAEIQSILEHYKHENVTVDAHPSIAKHLHQKFIF